MALTRKMLKAMGVEEEKIDQIIEAHSETVDSLKADRDNYKKDADQLKSVREELDELKAKGDDGWKEKHDKLKGDFDTYKKDVEAKETHSKKVEAFKAILKDGNFSEKGIEKAVKYADFEKMELDEDGKTIKNAPEHLKAAKEEWAEYVTTTTTTGAKTSNPPANNGTGTGKTKEEILAIKDGGLRRAEMAKNPHLFGLTDN